MQRTRKAMEQFDDLRLDVGTPRKPYAGLVRAVVLDWSGTAVDYGCLGPTVAFQEAFAAFDVAVDIQEVREFMGLKKIDHLRALTRHEAVTARWRQVHGRNPDESDVQAVYARTESVMLDRIADFAEPIPGLLDLIGALRARGVRIGSSTGYTRPMLEKLMTAAAGYGYRPDVAICSTDVPAGRPFPFMCYATAIALETYPLSSMVKIGDTLIDIEEGLNAGMWTIGLTMSGNELGLSRKQAESLNAQELSTRLEVIADRFRKAGAHYTARGIWEILPLIEAIDARLDRGERPR
ncbi:phosphonoacetaldehyde hydrolase [Desulfonatronum thioautotrophicum]|uniref:phosphonoacetaldehyde hydrolase n=1 Tax=Desulfonatronum thioautotrophicum TaxID=617001 RepID=UPI001FC90CC6|nr:phosphonoacetaldehyde hydrolase [Desulfonatronum thioautotrophicum]